MNDDANVGIQKKEPLVVHTRIILYTYIHSVTPNVRIAHILCTYIAVAYPRKGRIFA